MLLLFLLVLCLVLFILSIFFSSDLNGKEELVYHDWKWKRFLQDNGMIRKDMDYAVHMRDVYAPNKRRITREKEEKEMVRRTQSSIFNAISKGKSEIRVEIPFGCALSQTEVEEIVLITCQKLGYLEAKKEVRSNYHSASIDLGPRVE